MDQIQVVLTVSKTVDNVSLHPKNNAVHKRKFGDIAEESADNNQEEDLQPRISTGATSLQSGEWAARDAARNSRRKRCIQELVNKGGKLLDPIRCKTPELPSPTLDSKGTYSGGRETQQEEWEAFAAAEMKRLAPGAATTPPAEPIQAAVTPPAASTTSPHQAEGVQTDTRDMGDLETERATIFIVSNSTKSSPPTTGRCIKIDATNWGNLGFQLSSNHEDSTNAFVSHMSPECLLRGVVPVGAFIAAINSTSVSKLTVLEINRILILAAAHAHPRRLTFLYSPKYSSFKQKKTRAKDTDTQSPPVARNSIREFLTRGPPARNGIAELMRIVGAE
jgi:hypothetical protein